MQNWKIKVGTFLNYSAVSAVFADVWTLHEFPFAELRGPFIIMLFVLIIYALNRKKLAINRTFIVIFLSIITFSLSNIFIGNETLPLLVKQIVGVGFSALAFYSLIKINYFDINKLFKIYLNISVVVAVIGIFQQFSFLVGFRAGFDFSYFLPYWKYHIATGIHLLRINSILQEPGAVCYTLIPAFFIAITSLVPDNRFRYLDKWKSFIIISAVLLTFSSIGYIGIVIAIFLFTLNTVRDHRYFFISIAILFSSITFICYIYNSIPDIKGRVDNSFDYFAGTKSLNEINLSSMILFSNVNIAFKSFTANPLFGTGLGSYPILFDKYFETVPLKGFVNSYGAAFNRTDANSLFLRLLSETGLFGIIAVFYFLIKHYLSFKNDTSHYLWIINNGMLPHFIMRLIRGGHYFDSGFFFFIWMYYFSSVTSRKKSEAVRT